MFLPPPPNPPHSLPTYPCTVLRDKLGKRYDPQTLEAARNPPTKTKPILKKNQKKRMPNPANN